MRPHTLVLLAWLIVTQVTQAAAPPRFDVDRYGDPLPIGAVARLGTVRLRPVEARSMALSPDGKVIATGEEGFVRLWDFATGRLLHSRLMDERARMDVVALCFTPDGGWLIAAGEWERHSYHGGFPTTREWQAHLVPITRPTTRGRRLGVRLKLGSALALMDGGRLLVASEVAGAGPAVVVWDLCSDRAVFRIPGATAFTASPDGKGLVVGTEDGKVRVFAAAGWKERRSWAAHPHAVVSLAVSARGDRIATSGPPPRSRHGEGGPAPKERDAGVRLWDAAGEPVRTLPARLPGVAGLRFSPDGVRLFAVTGLPYSADGVQWHSLAEARAMHALAWDIQTGRAESSAPHTCRHIALAPDGEAAIALAGSLWLSRDGVPARHCVSEPLRGARCLSFTPDGKHVLALDGHPRVWDRRTGEERHAGAGHGGPVAELRPLPDGTLLSREVAGRWRLWDPRSGKTLPLKASPPTVDTIPARFLVRFPPKGGWRHVPAGLRIVFSGAKAEVHDVASGVLLRTIAHEDSERRAHLYEMRPHPLPDGSLWVASFGIKDIPLALICPETGRKIKGPVSPWSFSPDGLLMASGYDAVEVRETLTDSLLGRFPRGHLGYVHALAFSSDGSVLATGSSDTTILTWDWRHACGIFPLDASPEDAWRDLGSADARRAHSALLHLSRPDALPTLARGLRPVTAADCRAIREALLRIDDDDFELRSAAVASLAGSGADVFFLLHEALAKRPTLYAVKCIEKVIDAAPRSWSPDMLRRLRAVAALERIATPAARALLRQAFQGGLTSL